MFKQAKVLIAEDESLIAIEIKRFVERLDYKVVDVVSNYNDALKSAMESLPDIALLDINLGKNSKSGIEIAKDIQKVKNIPIVYLTANSDKNTVFEAAPTNPIGYITKPYSQETLKSTLLLASTKIDLNNRAMVNLSQNYKFDLNKNELYYKNKFVKLSKKEKQMLKILVEANNEIVSTQDMEKELYAMSSDDDKKNINGALRGLMHRFRSKLEENILESIHSSGFRIRRIA